VAGGDAGSGHHVLLYLPTPSVSITMISATSIRSDRGPIPRKLFVERITFCSYRQTDQFYHITPVVPNIINPAEPHSSKQPLLSPLQQGLAARNYTTKSCLKHWCRPE
jgi:hypothetical protein